MKCEQNPSTTTHERNPAFLLQEIRELAPRYRSLQYQFAALLELVHRHQYWRSAYKSFGEYVECEAGLKLRTAQELIRVSRICAEHGISREQVLELGWTKLALVASKINEENKDQILKEVKSQSYTKLKRKYRSRKSRRSAPQTISMSPVVAAAIRLAAGFSQSDDVADNLDFVAASFLHTVRQRSQHRPQWN